MVMQTQLNCAHFRNFTRNLSPEFGTCYTLNSADEEDRTGPYMVTKSGVFHGKCNVSW